MIVGISPAKVGHRQTPNPKRPANRGVLLCKHGFSTHVSLLQNPESEFDFFAARGEMEGAGAPFLA